MGFDDIDIERLAMQASPSPLNVVVAPSAMTAAIIDLIIVLKLIGCTPLRELSDDIEYAPSSSRLSPKDAAASIWLEEELTVLIFEFEIDANVRQRVKGELLMSL